MLLHDFILKNKYDRKFTHIFTSSLMLIDVDFSTQDFTHQNKNGL